MLRIAKATVVACHVWREFHALARHHPRIQSSHCPSPVGGDVARNPLAPERKRSLVHRSVAMSEYDNGRILQKFVRFVLARCEQPHESPESGVMMCK
jgi:hypothetical protein